jgi:CelD/BcsL family acetyltransferase involved in cellulose biosynthesis
VVLPQRFEAIPRAAWQRLLAATPVATPFNRWTFHRAWWDAYGATAHDQYLVCRPAEATGVPIDDADSIMAILPLMHRHEIEPDDAATTTVLRRRTQSGTNVRPDAKAVFMAASYHADYATILAAPEDLPDVAAALADSLAVAADDDRAGQPWDVIDLRRFRDDDPALTALERAFTSRAAGGCWSVTREQEDVCPVTVFPDGDWEAFLGSLGKKDRHEIRRKIRRAEAAGEIRFSLAALDAASADLFIDLHQARWGEQGLFPATEGGDRSRRFLHRLTELEAAEGRDAQLQLGQVRVGAQLIFATVGFDDGSTCFFYNAGMDPDARELSPGVTGTAAYLQDRLAAGRRRFDFLRGNEAYKYEWGALDEPIHRLLVARTG